MANRVFEDRLGLYVVSPANLAARLSRIRAFGIADVFLPRSAERADLARVRAAGLYAHYWAATDGLTASEYAARTLADLRRLEPGAAELNLELGSDEPLPAYIRDVVRLVRRARPKYRLRIGIAPWKAFALPIDLLESDPNLYADEQAYAGDMSPLSQADVLEDLLAWGVPRAKATVCYGAAGRPPGSSSRVCTLPTAFRHNRGVIFQDDLMAEVGLL